MPFIRRSLQRLHFVLGSLVGGLGFLFFSFLGLLYVALAPPRHRQRGASLFAHSFGVFMRAILGWRLDVEGLEQYEIHPSVIMVNHQSNLDVVTFGSIYPRRTVVIGKRELMRIPLFGWFFRGSGNILIDRGHAQRAHASMAAAAATMVARQVSVWMFPEGHRNQKPQLLPFKKGAFHLAIAAQAPVVPTVSEPITCVLDAARFLVRPGRIRIRILPPIPTEGLAPADLDALLERTRGAMQEAFDALAASARPGISQEASRVRPGRCRASRSRSAS